MHTHDDSEHVAVDAITTFAIASVAVCLLQMIHEGTHAVACLAVGGALQELSALHVSCDTARAWQAKFVSGSAGIINLLIGGALLIHLRKASGWSSERQYFVWLFMLMNGLLGSGYWMFSGLANVGDWANVIVGWRPHGLWRLMMTIAGAGLYLAVVWVSLRELGRIIGGGIKDEQIRRAIRLGLFAYAAVIFVILLAGVFSSYSLTGLPSVAALMLAVGGMSPLLWMMQWFRSDAFVKQAGEPLAVRRRWSWVLAGGAIVVLYGVVLGPTIYL